MRPLLSWRNLMSKLLNRRLLIFENNFWLRIVNFLQNAHETQMAGNMKTYLNGVSEGERIGSSEVVSWLRSSEAVPSKCLSSEEVQ